MSQHQSICRFCAAACPVLVDIEDDKVLKVTGNKASPTYHGFCCTRGQAMPEQMNSPDRLLHSQRRSPDGAYHPIGSAEMMDEVAAKIAHIVERHGPKSVAVYIGTMNGHYPASAFFGVAWMTALKSPSVYSVVTIDQPGKNIAAALSGTWEGGSPGFDESDVWLMIGGNPLVSILSTMPPQNPARRLTTALERGMKLIVIDPRKTETASRAHIHLQSKPGEDATILASMIHVILAEGLEDREFLAAHVDGLAALRQAVALFDPDYAAARAGIERDQIVAAARTFGQARAGMAAGSTGANMSGRSTLTEYLINSLNMICGRFRREGDAVDNPGVLMPRAMPRAQARPPYPALDTSQKMSVRGLFSTIAGPPTAALADEILAGNVRALISLGGSPVVAWPDQARTLRALAVIDLFVQFDIRMSPSARMADYVIASKMMMEVPTSSRTIEALEWQASHWMLPEPFGFYAPRLVPPPKDSDLIEEWEFFYTTAQRLGLQLEIDRTIPQTNLRRAAAPPIKLDMTNKPTTEELLELFAEDSRIPLSEVKAHPNGALFPEDIRVAPADPACTAKLDIGNGDLMAELAAMAEEDFATDTAAAYPFRLISRRAPHLYNSSGLELPRLQRKGGTYNPAFMHPADIEELCLAAGEEIRLVSPSGSIAAIAQPDAAVRRGVISMSHAHGGLPQDKMDATARGSNTGALVSVEQDYDRYSGIPHMSNIPVRVEPKQQRAV